MAAAAQSPEQRELALVGKVEMRIALADTDSKLESIMKTYLAPLMLKLTSEHASVRTKVIAVTKHISTRTEPNSIQLPVDALVKQFKDQESALIRHFDLIYIQQGVDRLSPSAKAELLPTVIAGISKSGTHGPQIFNLLLRLLESFTLPPRGSKDDSSLRQDFHVSDEDAKYLAEWLGNFMLFSPSRNASTSPGLSDSDHAFINLSPINGTTALPAGGLNLLRTKVLAARLLSSGLFNEKERFLPALFASADPASSISDVADDMMKRCLPEISLEDEALVRTLFDLYFGKDGVLRVRAPLRLKILGLLNRSSHSTTFSHEIMRVVDDGLSQPSMDGEDVVMSNAAARYVPT
jgi:proteasome component ECM29